MKLKLLGTAILILSFGVACNGNSSGTQGSSTTRSNDISDSPPAIAQGTGQSGSTQGTGESGAMTGTAAGNAGGSDTSASGATSGTSSTTGSSGSTRHKKSSPK